jgi:hypothetical protein
LFYAAFFLVSKSTFYSLSSIFAPQVQLVDGQIVLDLLPTEPPQGIKDHEEESFKVLKETPTTRQVSIENIWQSSSTL